MPVIGRLVARGLDDELKGSAYVVIDGVAGRAHHIRLPHPKARRDGRLPWIRRIVSVVHLLSDTRCDERIFGRNFWRRHFERRTPVQSEEYRRRVVAEANEPEASVAGVARRHGLNANLLFKWIRRPRDGWVDGRRTRGAHSAPESGESLTFVPITVVESRALQLKAPSSAPTLKAVAARSRPGETQTPEPPRRHQYSFAGRRADQRRRRSRRGGVAHRSSAMKDRR